MPTITLIINYMLNQNINSSKQCYIDFDIKNEISQQR